MHLEVYSVKPFPNEKSCSVSYSSKNAPENFELYDLVSRIEGFYRRHLVDETVEIPINPRVIDKGSLLYQVLSLDGYVGSIRITPKGRVIKKGDSSLDEDYQIADQDKYIRTYWIDFYPGQKRLPQEVKIRLRREHRDGFVNFIDPENKKRR